MGVGELSEARDAVGLFTELDARGGIGNAGAREKQEERAGGELWREREGTIDQVGGALLLGWQLEGEGQAENRGQPEVAGWPRIGGIGCHGY